MQKFTTPEAGRTPAKPNVVNTDWYKLDITLRPVPINKTETELKIRRWTPEVGWTTMNLFLSPEELNIIRQELAK